MVDTDLLALNDDAYALHFLLETLGSPELVTTCTGNTLASTSRKHAQMLLDELGCHTAVHAGHDDPQTVSAVTRAHQAFVRRTSPHLYLGATGKMSHDYPRRPTIDKLLPNASSFDYIALGPLSNLAGVWARNRGAFTPINEVIFSGGAFEVEGNVGPYSEFNVYADPDSAATVFREAPRITIVPLDVTSSLVYGQEVFSALTAQGGRFALAIRKVRGAAFAADPRFEEAMWDLVTAMIYVMPEVVVASTRGYVQVETSPGAKLGKTNFKLSAAGNVVVVRQVDHDLILRTFVGMGAVA